MSLLNTIFKKFTLIFCILITVSSFAQQIRGKVLTQQNNPLSGANVYFDGTSLSTITDENGLFVLNYNSKLNSVLVISFVGYQTVFIDTVSPENEFIIKLDVEIDVLKEVLVQFDAFTRKQKMQLFKEMFIGRKEVSDNVIIENEEDIYFEYDEKKFILKAYSDKPLRINNKTLGYKITYELVNFEVKFSLKSINSHDVIQSFYAGLSRFELVNNDKRTLKLREKNYRGSQLHFFRNLALNKWDKKEFLLFKGSYQVNPSDWFTLIDENNLKKVLITITKESATQLTINTSFNVLFDNKLQSKITFKTASFYIDQFGNNSNIEDILFTGYMSQQKVGSLLPLNYGIE